MSAADQDRARRALASLSLFTEREVEGAAITRLFGLTNAVFRVNIAGESLCLRIPGAGTAAIIDRKREETNARAAALAGVAPEVVHFAPDGVMLTRFIEGGPLSPQRFRIDQSAIGRVAGSLRTLHDHAHGFAGLFDVFERIAFYRGLLGRKGIALAPDQNRLVDDVEPIRLALAASAPSLKPCHCDPTGRNLIDDGARVWLIDWEYSGMNDPVWDLAYLSIEASFDESQDRALLAAYHERAASPHEAARVEAFKALCQVLSALWALVQHAGGNHAADFHNYAEVTFAEAAQRLGSADFRRQLADLRA
jgi:thiamine kinase-like enzyme